MEDLEHDLIRAIGAGDRLAFEKLVRRYQGPVLSFVCRHIGDRHTAEDLTQEVFLRVYRAAAEFEPRAKVQTWIFKIAYNLCLNELKRLRRLRGLHDDLTAQTRRESEGSAASAIHCGELEEEITNALRQLPENQRAALLLRANKGLSYLEISRVLSVSVSSVESLIFRARAHLREALGKNA
jgi:RNA polymerase sigma-70 factor, ECF subfamily